MSPAPAPLTLGAQKPYIRKPRPKPTADEDDAVARFIAARGVTKCPSPFTKEMEEHNKKSEETRKESWLSKHRGRRWNPRRKSLK